MQGSIVKTVETVKKARAAYKFIVLLGSPAYVVLIIIAVLIAFVVLLTMLPFLLFAEEGSLNHTGAVSSSWGPVQLDADGSNYQWPVPSITRITSYFGIRNIGDGAEAHGGIDIADGATNTELQPIYAIAAGTVTIAGTLSTYGQAIYIDHGGGLVSIYGHLDTRMDVKPGSIVNKGQRIGRIGAGKVGRSTGPHLHFEVRVNNKRVNPLDYVQPIIQVSNEISYRPLNLLLANRYLVSKKSALADRSILAAIDQAGKAQNVDPMLLLAITGQEQSFVPITKKHADLIVKNPWNVFGCWCSGKGATLSTEQSALIAAKTIVKLSQDRPINRNAIEWLSAKDNPRGYYAEHNGWWIGVSKFYQVLLNLKE
ncbi:M23 family metallopeptidase [Paenibacillus sinopodophylli]|uniref:M23 family metallopeptidase n=1 Tax=Paenibacillus sinopodophylli TaxID=1837342 RepID=UPI00110C953D|nr:M23 family metallopeptidase [Paenibacillus sinopodophylli]